MIGLERVGPSRLANGSASALVTSSMKMATKKKTAADSRFLL